MESAAFNHGIVGRQALIRADLIDED